jgi:phenylalanyl-tRNA synthetase beta chain
MKVSFNWLSELVDLKSVGGSEAVAELLTRRGIEVEEIQRQGKGLEKVVTAQILERGKHPNSDRLSLCKVSVGSGDPLEIVCGAQNMKSGDKVALAQIGASLPNGMNIVQSKIRDVVSNGMLCSEEELGFKTESEGILILPKDAALGLPLAKFLGLDDVVLTLKLTANRGDCLSHFGLARELAAALGVKPKKPAAPALSFTKTPIAIQLNAGEHSPQFFGCAIDGVKVGPSPAWVVKRLEAVGSRSINNVVDATNLVMLELGHPVHAYDAEKIRGGLIQVRTAKAGESLPLLDGTTVDLKGDELVIGDAQGAIGLAGVMGGGNSEVSDHTTKVFLECAEFHAASVRKASSRFQKKTDAAHRFERGIDSMALPEVIARLAQLVVELAGGKIVASVQAGKPSPRKREIVTSPDFVEGLLGAKGVATQVEKILTGLDCVVKSKAPGSKAHAVSVELTVVPPSYRLDLNSPEDLAEEVARSIGYDQIEETIPQLSSSPSSIHESPQAARLGVMNRAKDALVRLGLNETVNFAFTSKSWLAKFGMKSEAVLMNPLSEEFEALVPSLLPGLVKNALENWHHHFGSEVPSLRFFEIRPTFHTTGPVQAKGESETGVTEKWRLAFLITGTRLDSGLKSDLGETQLPDVKAVIESLLGALGTKGYRFQPLSASRTSANDPTAALFHPGQSVELLAGKGSAGYFGLLHPGVARQLKTRAPVWLAELDWEAIAGLSRAPWEVAKFKAWPPFPSIERDFALLVPSGVTVDKITQVATKSGKPLAKVAKVFDIYRGSQVAEGMTSVAVRVIFYDESRSLQETEAEAASAQILAAWKKELGVELRG